MAAVPEAAVSMARRQGGSDGQARERNSQPRCHRRCCLPRAQRHSALSVEIVLADAGNRLGSGGTSQGSGHAVVAVVGFTSPLESRTSLL